MPDPLKSILERVDSVGPAPKEDEVVRDDPASRVSPSLGIWEAQCHLVADPTPGFRTIPNVREGGFVHAERVRQPALTKEPEAPSPSTGGPNERGVLVCWMRAQFLLTRRTRSSSPSFRSSSKRVRTAAM